MPSVRYGTRVIEYAILEKEGLKGHYISVDNVDGVILKGKAVSPQMADKLILKKARWIIEKLQLVRSVAAGDIVTGSRLPYLGRSYYVQVVVNKQIDRVQIEFTWSRFIITINNSSVSQAEIQSALQNFYKQKAIEKIGPRVEKLSQQTGLVYQGLQFRKMNKRWGSCTAANRIILNIEAVKLPYSLIDYVIVHELVHTRVKDHSRAYWSLLGRHMRNWKTLDAKLNEVQN